MHTVVSSGCPQSVSAPKGLLIPQSQFQWLKGRVSERDTQISDLLDKLSQFNQQYNRLKEFVDDGNRLLDSEKPVGDNATRVQEQMDACQVGWCMYVVTEGSNLNI